MGHYKNEELLRNLEKLKAEHTAPTRPARALAGA